MLDQMQIIPMHDLSPLLTHPDFQRGVADAESCFEEWYDSAPLTEDQMINEVEENLSRRTYTQSVSMMRGNSRGCPSYIHHLGFVFGTINEGLSDFIG